MEIVYDELTNRFFKADIRELAIKERELNLRLAYDWANTEWKKTQITYNDLINQLITRGLVFHERLLFRRFKECGGSSST